MQSRVAQVWQPDLTIDTHATNGSVHRLQMTYDVPHTVASGRAEPVAFMREQMMPAVTAALARDHRVLAGWYGNFVEDERTLDARGEADPHAPVGEGWMTYTHHPRFGSNYRGLTSRLDLLLECYSYLEFPERVRTTYATLLEAFRYVAAHQDDVLQVVARLARPARPGRRPLPARCLRRPDHDPDPHAAHARRRPGRASPLRYFGNFVGTTVVDRPPAYVVPPELAAHLERHGLPTEAVSGELPCEVATIAGFGSEGGRKILESASVGDVSVEWKRATRAVPAGARLVRTDHAHGAIAVYLCEPEERRRRDRERPRRGPGARRRVSGLACHRRRRVAALAPR